MPITITDNAFQRIAELLKTEENSNMALRISVDGGGCSGFVYNYELVPHSTIENDDHIIRKENSMVVIDPSSLEFISGSVFDYVESLTSSSFEIRNPSAKTKCGCGKSFSV